MNRAKNVCGQKSKVVTELFKMTRKENPWRNNRGSDAAWESSRGGAKATCDCQNGEIRRGRSTRRSRRASAKAEDNPGHEIPPTRSGQRPMMRSTWREHHANVAVWNDDRGGTMWRYEYEYARNVDMRTVTGADSNSCGYVVKSLKYHANVAVWSDARGGSMWRYEYEYARTST